MITSEQLEAYCRGLYDAWNRGDMEAFYDGIHEHVVDHNAGEGETGIQGVREALDTVREAFPDHQYEVLDVVADAGSMSFVCRLRASGTHKGNLFGIPPSNQHATWDEARFIRVEEAEPDARWPVRTREHRAIVDSLSMMTQLGHVSPPGQRESW